MSEHIHIDGQNEEVEFEQEDLGARPILMFLAALVVGCLLVALLLRGMYRYLDAYENRHEPVQNPLAQQGRADPRLVGPENVAKFPQPRLESNETVEIDQFRLQEEQALNSYGWVDEGAGVVRIPIDRAMELIAQRGLPTRPQAGVAPPSAVNTVKQAAHKSDTSGLPAKKK
jgi:hypothetical protein